MTRKDADRPPVRCTECRHYIPGGRLCPVARKLFFPDKWSTCKKFASAELQPLTLLEELQARLVDAGLSDAVVEMGEDEYGRIWIRFSFAASVDQMTAAARVFVGAAAGPSNDLT